jgi:hypothetical protein
VGTIENKKITKMLNDRIKYWLQPKPENITVSPSEVKINTEELFKFCSRMIVEELKFIKKQMRLIE